jgi:hypothetical protein
VWNLTTGFASPESAFYDAASNAVFVSSINGRSSRRTATATSRACRRREGGGREVGHRRQRAEGLRSARGVLYAADIDTVVGFDIKSGKEVSRVPIDGAVFLNDLATAPDGTIYVSDSTALKIFEVRNGTASVFVEAATGGAAERPAGRRRRPDSRHDRPAPAPGAPAGGGARGPGAERTSLSRSIGRRSSARCDTAAGRRYRRHRARWRGGLLVTDVIGQRLLRVSKAGAVTVLAKFTAGGADFGYIAARKLAVVPFLFSNSVAAYDLTASLRP